MTRIRLHCLTKRFGQFPAVTDAELDIRAGELFFLLGPSGCGKTTLLRMLAGLETPTSGRIHFNEVDVTELSPERRRCAMVFQHYALWPHMTVRGNVAFGLDVRKLAADEKKNRIHAALSAVRLGEQADRKPAQLSGGQQQRVALARALVVEPSVLLLDEPLSNLDAKLRQEMRGEIRRLCVQTSVTAVYVTHDQKEALSMADRIAVMDRGRIVQVGAPGELYRRPATRFVADFLGQTNFLPGKVINQTDGVLQVRTAAGLLRAAVFPTGLEPDRAVTCSIRPEAIRAGASFSGAGTSDNRLEGRLTDSVYLGELSQNHYVLAGDMTLVAYDFNPRMDAPAGQMTLSFSAEDVVILTE